MGRIAAALAADSEIARLSYAGDQPAWLFRRAVELFPDAFQSDTSEDFLDLSDLAAFNLRHGAAPQAVPGLSEAQAALDQRRQYDFTDLSGETVRGLYGRELSLSASRIDKYAGCRLAYFLTYGLKAAPRKQAKLDPSAFGTFVHAVLEGTVNAVTAEGGFQQVPVERLTEIAVAEMDRYAAERFPQTAQRAAHLFRRARREVLDVVLDMGEELRRSGFQPVSCELEFSPAGPLPAVEIQGQDAACRISGFVDRVDLYEKDGKTYVRVVDYKTGQKDFDFTDILYGAGLQMLIYLFALKACGGDYYHQGDLIPAGVLYLPARQTYTLTQPQPSDEEVAEVHREERRRRGLILSWDSVLAAMEEDPTAPRYMPYQIKKGEAVGNLATGEQMALLERHVRRVLAQMTDQIAAGTVRPNPVVRGNEGACKYCDYKTVCHGTSAPGRRGFWPPPTQLRSGRAWKRRSAMAEVKLTAAQQAAVTHRGGALLVSAAAGSGKTKVLVERLLSRILDEDDPKNIDDFLVITYTKAAAAELRLKIAQALNERLAAAPGDRRLKRQLHRIYLADISTVHAFCSNLLRTYGHRLDLPGDFRVAEEAESQALQERVLERLLEEAYGQEDEAFLSMAAVFGYGRDDRRLPGAVMKLHREMRCRPDMDAWRQETLAALELQDVTDAAETPWGRYLLDEFHRFLESRIAQFRAALQELPAYPRIQKGLEPVFRENLQAMEALLAAQGWDGLVAGKITSFGRAGAVRQPEDAQVKERLSKLRTVTWSELKTWQDRFFGDSQAVLADLRETAPALKTLVEFAARFDAAYAAEKRRRRILDFSDLEHQAIRLLTDRYTHQPTAVAREISARYCEILVDEYQDSNAVQETIFEALSQGGRNRFMVGDVKQSIYRFRLADPTLFLGKYETYPDAAAAQPGEPGKLLLSENFRSRPEILAACNQVFGLVMRKGVGGLAYGPREALRPGRAFPPLRSRRWSCTA